ncbi:MAG: MarR family transcriptional regulator [Rothia dentocariosa]
MTSVLRRLVRDGWVERRPSETDLRSFTIHATSADRHAYLRGHSCDPHSGAWYLRRLV